jgi:hypothetical protein
MGDEEVFAKGQEISAWLKKPLFRSGKFSLKYLILAARQLMAFNHLIMSHYSCFPSRWPPDWSFCFHSAAFSGLPQS